MRKTACLVVLGVLVAACGGSSAPAPSPSATTSPPPLASGIEMIPDPVGDSAPSAPGYLDTVAYGVSETGGHFTFAFEVAEPIPDSFEVPMGYDAAQWSFCLDTDLSSAPGGYPFVAIGQVPCEFIVTAVSEGGPAIGTLIDRRPLAHGKEAETSSIPVTIDEATGAFTVPAAQLGDPSRFDWAMTASVIALPLPSDDFDDLDANYEAMYRWTG